MSASVVMAFITFLIGQAKEVYIWGKQQHGEAIPEWDTILKGFDSMQAKIDAAKREP